MAPSITTSKVHGMYRGAINQLSMEGAAIDAQYMIADMLGQG
jgi:hypothetical protein